MQGIWDLFYRGLGFITIENNILLGKPTSKHLFDNKAVFHDRESRYSIS